MQGKVEICGVNTAQLPVLKSAESRELLEGHCLLLHKKSSFPRSRKRGRSIRDSGRGKPSRPAAFVRRRHPICRHLTRFPYSVDLFGINIAQERRHCKSAYQISRRGKY